MYNTRNKPLVRYFSWINTISLPKKVGSSLIPDFAAAIDEWRKRRPYDLLTISFEGVLQPYSNGMLPIIATIVSLRLRKHKIKIILPNDANVRKIFRITNWAFFLDNSAYQKSESTHDKHLVTQPLSDRSFSGPR